jgi:hypothetical protein
VLLPNFHRKRESLQYNPPTPEMPKNVSQFIFILSRQTVRMKIFTSVVQGIKYRLHLNGIWYKFNLGEDGVIVLFEQRQSRASCSRSI